MSAERDDTITVQLDIVIPNFNGKEYLGNCLDSLRQQGGADFSVIVVDNGSKDGSLELMSQDYPEVRVISWAENRGFSAAVNAGIAAGSAPLVFLLNNDTELAEGCLAALILAAHARPDYDFFAAKMLNYYHHATLDGAGDAFLRGGVGYRLGTMESDGPCYAMAREVFGACAGAALYRRQFFDEMGCFDEDFFAYLEDVDLNLRANMRGKRCWYVSKARVYHIGSATSGSKINAFTVSLSTRNNLCILVKNYPLSLLFRFAPAICVYQLIWFCLVLKKAQVMAYLKGLLSFLRFLPRMLKKRRENMQRARISGSALATLMRHAEEEVLHSIMRRRSEQGKGNLLFSLYLRVFL